MNAVTDYMKGFGPDSPEVSNNAVLTYLLIDPQAATVLASVILSTYFAKGVSMLMKFTPLSHVSSAKSHAGSSQLNRDKGVDREHKVEVDPSERPGHQQTKRP